MNHTLALALLLSAALTTASPITKRQFGFGSSSTSSDLEDGSCKAVTFIFARGSTETGNMGMTVGPATCTALKSDLGEDAVACQGVGGSYIADIGSNALPDGTTQAAIEEATGLFELARTQCPETQVVAGGYS